MLLASAQRTGFDLMGRAYLPGWVFLLAMTFIVFAFFGMYHMGLKIQQARNRDYIKVIHENLARGAATTGGGIAPNRTVKLALVLDMLQDMEEDLGD